MKIEAIDLFYIALPEVTRAADSSQDSLVVRVTADNGLIGWGESDGSPLGNISAFVMPMSHGNIINLNESLLGETIDSPEDVVRLRAKAGRYALDLQQVDHAVSGVDVALWDLLGKYLGEPVYRLLGYETSYPKLPYSSVLFGETPAETQRIAERIRSDGYNAAKFGWSPMGEGTLEDDVALIAAAREGLGAGPKLMIDAGVIWGSDDGAVFERTERFAEFDVTWLEEPLLPDEVDAYRRLKDRRPSIAIAAGEGCDFYRAAEDLMVNGGVDYLQIDVARIGGITIADRVCRRAQELGVTYVNHNYKSHLTVAASIHIFAGVEEFKLFEYPDGVSPLIRGLTAPTGIFVNSDGMVQASDAPGLGVEANVDTIRQYLRQVRIEVDGKVLYETPVV
ncbi:MAG: mandelate racemase/muconate lactonizing enzyme family protein [Chloroflexi bacterium]|nr:mandelate racemase/muconate lactonizing enzyme family protein [Chloroflexota bacterium]